MIVEAALRETTCQRHLTAFKSVLLCAAAGFLTLVTLCGGLADTGTRAAAHTLGALLGAICRSQIMDLHTLTLLLCFFDFFDLDKVLYLEDLTADAGIVRFHDAAVELLETERLDRVLLIAQAGNRALDQSNFQHCFVLLSSGSRPRSCRGAQRSVLRYGAEPVR